MTCIEDHIKTLKPARQQHIYGVAETAEKLAARFGADPEKARIAALYHDMFRSTPVDVLNEYVKELKLGDTYLNNPNLAHGKIAAEVMERQYGITDPDILNAVRYHTTGRKGMSKLEKILYLADAIEPSRSHPGVEDVRKLAETSLDEACLCSMERSIAYVKEQGQFLHEDTIEAKKELKKGELNEL